MSDMFVLTRQQLNRIKPYFPVSHGVPRADDQRDHLGDPVRPSMEGCAEGLWPAQDTRQSVYTLEPSRDLSQDLPRVVATLRGERLPDDRRHTSEGPQHGGESA